VTAAPSTRERILGSSAELFADRGFRKVTVRDICRAAQVNVAAVNYHFGDKLGLYQEVLQRAIDAMRGTTEEARRLGAGLSAEERLRRFVAVFVKRILTSGSQTIHRLIHREINDPTPAFDRLVEEGVRPRIEYLAGLVGEIIGCSPTDERALWCAFSIQAQTVACFPNPVAVRLGFNATPALAGGIAGHIAAFSLHGIEGQRRAKRPRRPRRPPA
jgi:TetR/AcrR family transcriptional regulator, regulator of cefoperazone and chloramphenicol sensitivity